MTLIYLSIKVNKWFIMEQFGFRLCEIICYFSNFEISNLLLRFNYKFIWLWIIRLVFLVQMLLLLVWSDISRFVILLWKNQMELIRYFNQGAYLQKNWYVNFKYQNYINPNFMTLILGIIIANFLNITKKLK